MVRFISVSCKPDGQDVDDERKPLLHSYTCKFKVYKYSYRYWRLLNAATDERLQTLFTVAIYITRLAFLRQFYIRLIFVAKQLNKNYGMQNVDFH